MIFLINCSNLKAGGGLQVADSVCGQLDRFSREHRFVVVLSRFLDKTAERIKNYDNVEVLRYDLPQSFRSVVLGRDKFLDGFVEERKVDAVLTVFGPSLWRPRLPHLCGFARAQLLLTDDVKVKGYRLTVREVKGYRLPVREVKGYRLTVKERIVHRVWAWGFRRSSRVFYTENAYISAMLPRLIKGAEVYTVSNYYNQVFDQPERWQRNVKLPEFEGTTLLSVSSAAAHKNLGIMVPAAEWLEREHPDFNFRFVLTCKEAPFELPERLKKHFVFIGRVDVSECPNLYEQADIMFMPTLMECFTATYPEAMRMQVPIVTTDLEFAHGLCGDAACYYSAVDARAAAQAIYKVATDEAYRSRLTANGKEQLKSYDSYEQRAEKLVEILASLVKN